MKKLILLATLASALFASCQKNDNLAPSTISGTRSNALIVPVRPPIDPTLLTDVYVVGTYTANSEYSSAAYWKNGTLVDLGQNGSLAHGIVVSGNNIYVAGQAIQSGNPNAFQAAYWLNGTEVDLSYASITHYSSRAFAIALKGTDVYVVGDVTNVDNNTSYAMIWKNGVATNLAYNSYNSGATSIAIRNDTVLVAGYSSNASIPSIGTYWINNTAHLVRTGAGPSSTSGVIFDNSGNFYISGNLNNSISNTGVYWYNGIYQYILSSPVSVSNTSGITFSGGSIYIAGQANNTAHVGQASYWQNGTYNVAEIGSSMALDIQFAGSVKYVLTYQYPTGGYYRNGVFTSIPNCGGEKICIIQHILL